MTQKDFILQYVAAKIAGRSVDQNLSFIAESLKRSVKSAIQEATWVYEALPNELKIETNKS